MRMTSKVQSLEASRIWEPRYDLARLLTFVRECEPLTIPEVLAELPRQLKTPGTWRLVLAAHPQIVVWDDLPEVTATLLTQLLSTQQLSLQICHSALYAISGVKPHLPVVQSVLHAVRQECWLPCTVGAGPSQGLNSEWRIAFRNGMPVN